MCAVRYISEGDRSVGQFYSDFIGAYGGNFGPGSDINRFFPAIGNHDYSEVGGIKQYLDYVSLPGGGIATSGTSGSEPYYDYIQGPVQFFVVDSDSAEPDGVSSTSAQASWLQSALAASTTPGRSSTSTIRPTPRAPHTVLNPTLLGPSPSGVPMRC